MDKDFLNADLRGDIFVGADLRRANFTGADLTGANFTEADLTGANFTEADLTEADLTGANLKNAILEKADLTEANLTRANLILAYLVEANLIGANLTAADLGGADLTRAKLSYIPMACPDEGEFTGYKVANDHIVVLKIPADAKRSSATGRNCRCSKAYVEDILNLDGSKSELNYVRSDWDMSFIYRLHKMVEVKNFDENRFNECSRGIHFFMNKQEAINYNDQILN